MTYLTTNGRPSLEETRDVPAEPSFAGFLRAVRRKDDRTLNRVYKSSWKVTNGPAAVTKAGMSESGGTVGGYIVPGDYSARFLKCFTEESFIYPRAFRVPMGSDTLTGPRIDVETAPGTSGITPLVGGIKFTWGSEQAPTETEPAFKAADLKAWDLLGYAVISNQEFWDMTASAIAEDADNLLYQLFAKAAAWQAEYAFLQGIGAGGLMPLGILKSPALLTVSPRSGASKIANGDIANMAAAFLPYSWRNGIWLCSPTCLGQIATISSFTLNRPANDKVSASVGSLLTLPLFVTEKLPPLGTLGDILLIDPSLYLIGDRQQVLIDISEHPGFRNAQTTIRVWLRIDGKPMTSGPITLQDKTTKVSPFVALAA